MLIIRTLDMMRMTSVVFSRTHNPILIMRKIADKSQLREILQNASSVLLKTVRVIKGQGNFEKLSEPRRAQGDK